jgi:hypothetical protein
VIAYQSEKPNLAEEPVKLANNMIVVDRRGSEIIPTSDEISPHVDEDAMKRSMSMKAILHGGSAHSETK